MAHLATEAVVAFVDGELSMVAYQRAAAHLDACPECAADVEAQRYARAAVRSAEPLTMPANLRGSLRRIPETSAPTAPAPMPTAPVPMPGFFQQAPLPTPSAQAPLPTPSAQAPLPTPSAAAKRTKRSVPLGMFAASVLAVGVLASTAAASETTPAQQPAETPVAQQPAETPVAQPLVAPAPSGAELVSPAATAGAGQVSFGVMFDNGFPGGGTGQAGTPQMGPPRQQSAQIKSVPLQSPRTLAAP